MRGITFKVVVEKSTTAKLEDRNRRTQPKGLPPPGHIPKKLKVAGSLAIIILFIVVQSAWKYYRHQQIVSMDPFTAHTHSLVSFPLFYPTEVPAGYHIDKTSVSNPDKDVIVFTISDADKEHFIYLSEEAKPSSFNFKGYYLGFSNRKNIDTPYGVAVMGTVSINGSSRTEVGSLASNDTWFIADTNTDIPFTQLQYMLKSIVISN